VRVDDPAYVERQYATERNLAARKALYDEVDGEDARELAFRAVAEAAPARVLEVGCGEGELAARMAGELGVDVVAIDQSPRMVELAVARGVDARVADVQALPFEDESFDVAVAAWVLFHVPDLDRGIAELARVLRPSGRLVAVTNYVDHLFELFELAGALEQRFVLTFGAESGEERLSRRFARVERRDAHGTVTIRDAEAVRAYLRSSERLAPYAQQVPELSEPLVARRRQAVFVADRPSAQAVGTGSRAT
jgi:SAM-dependent methyltransferase